MNNSFSTPRKTDHTFNINGINSKYTPRHIENSVHRYFMPSIGSNEVTLQWQDDDNILSEQENSFYLSLGKRVIDIIITLGVIIFVLSWLATDWV
jgi:putative colanic acid biosynthesis UDP-glucose lipid carrier transferase